MLAPRPRGAVELLADPDSALFRSLESLVFHGNEGNLPAADRRATSRVPAQVVCEEKQEGRRHHRLTWDLSTFGLSTVKGPQYPLGTRLQVALYLPDDLAGPLSFTAEVVGTNRVTGGMRLAFRNPAMRAVRRLHRFLFGPGPLEV